MRPNDIFLFRRKEDRVAIGDLLQLEGREAIFYRLRFVERKSLQQVAMELNLSYSYTSHISCDVSKYIKSLPSLLEFIE